jgi:hypothetical protein
MKTQVLNLIKNKEKFSGGGIYIVTILGELKIKFGQLKPILNELHAEKKIEKRLGVNGILIMLKKKK